MFCEKLCGARDSAWHVFELIEAMGSTVVGISLSVGA